MNSQSGQALSMAGAQYAAIRNILTAAGTLFCGGIARLLSWTGVMRTPVIVHAECLAPVARGGRA